MIVTTIDYSVNSCYFWSLDCGCDCDYVNRNENGTMNVIDLVVLPLLDRENEIDSMDVDYQHLQEVIWNVCLVASGT